MAFMRPMILSQDQKQLSIFDEIRAGFAFVAARARHVKIREDRLATYARSLPVRHPATVFDTEHHFIGTPEGTAAYVLTLDAVNFGSGYEPHLVREGWALVDQGIYFTLATRLKKRFEQGGISADYLSRIEQNEITQLFELPQGPCGQELSGLFTQGIRDLGTLIAKEYEGSFLSFVEAAQGRAGNIVRQLQGLPQFQDAHEYQGRMVGFYKRAQITAADLHLAFAKIGKTLFDDMKSLTMFPDNGVPQVLFMDGILEYTPALMVRIEKGEELSSGSAEEIEIRACAGHTVELLAALMSMKAVDVDHILWHRHAEDPVYVSKPSHRTRSTFY